MIPPLGRRMRPPRRVAGLPALAPAPGLHHRPGRDLPVPALPTAGLAGRPGPYRALGRRRTDLHLQHRRILSAGAYLATWARLVHGALPDLGVRHQNLWLVWLKLSLANARTLAGVSENTRAVPPCGW